MTTNRPSMSREDMDRQIQEELKHNIVRVSAEKFVVSEAEGDVKIAGFALPYDKASRNGNEYIRESVIEAAESMVGRPVLWNHNADWVIGKVKSFEAREDGCHYENELDPAEEYPVRKIKREEVTNVSISCEFDPERSEYDESEGVMKLWVKEFLELSHVTIPGFADTTAKARENFLKPTKASEDAMSKKDIKKTQEASASNESDDEEEPMDPVEQFQEKIDSLEAKLQDHEARLASLEGDKDEEGAEGNSEASDEEPEDDKEESSDDDDEEEPKGKEDFKSKAQESRKVPVSQEQASVPAKTLAVSEEELKEALTNAL